MTNKNPEKGKQEEKDIVDLKKKLFLRWNEFYKGGDAFGLDFYPCWKGFQDQLLRSLSNFRKSDAKKQQPPKNISILVPGCGTSLLSLTLYKLGYTNIRNVDISSDAIKHMKQHCYKPGMVWEFMCMHDMAKYSNGSFHAIIDKAAFDFVRSEDGMALTSDEAALKYVGCYFSEVHRLLKNGGKFIYFVELLVEKERDWSRLEVLFKHFRIGWNVDIHGLPEDTITSSELKMAMFIFEKTTDTAIGSPIQWHINEIFCWRLSGNTHKFLELVELENEDHRRHPTVYSGLGLTKEAILNLKKLSFGRRLHLNLGECLTTEHNAVLLDGRRESYSLGYLILYVPLPRVQEPRFSSRDGQWLLVETLDAARVVMIFEDVPAGPIHIKVDHYYSLLEDLAPQSFKDDQIEVRTALKMSPPEKPHFETIGHVKRGIKKGARFIPSVKHNAGEVQKNGDHHLHTIDEQTSRDRDGDRYDRDEQTLEKKDIDGDSDEQTLEKKAIHEKIRVCTASKMSPPEKPHFETVGHVKHGRKNGELQKNGDHLLLREDTTDEQTSGDIDGDIDEQILEKKDIDEDRYDRDIDGDRDEQTLEKNAILEKKTIHEKIMRSCLEYFNKIRFTESRRTLEKESGIFNMSYFEHLIESGDWKEAEHYLSAFVDTSCGILYQIQTQSSLEVAMVAALKAGKKLDIGDREFAKCEIIDEVKKLTMAGFQIPENLNFPEDSYLWRLFSQSHCDPGLDYKHDLMLVSAFEVGHAIRPPKLPTHVGGKKKMVIYYDKNLGVGMTSKVREGIYDGRKVAVKCLFRTKGIDSNPTDEVVINPKEVQSLVEAGADSHENVVTCYGMEVDEDYIYIALELCSCTLDELITGKKDAGIDTAKLRKKDYYPSSKLLGIMRDIICGLGHLHKLRYIHGDLNPNNILIKQEDGHLCAKISDMGMSKRLRVGSSSGTNSIKSSAGGQSGIVIYKAPEQILGTDRISQAADMFSLGCILFFCITKGKHPFGDSACQDSILNNDKDLLMISDDFPEACDIIGRLLSPEAARRPTIEEVKNQPFLWESIIRIQFLKAASDKFESEKKKVELEGSTSELLLRLESIKNSVFGKRWDNRLDSPFVNYIDSGVHGFYDYEKVYDLLRLIRNKSHHWRELPEDVRNLMPQPVTLGIEEYFSTRFPNLLFEVYKIICELCPDDVGLRQYISGNSFG